MDDRKTCLYDRHIALGAQMSPFGGFIMPIQYTSITGEHLAVRNRAGMFDVSHMGEITVTGPDSERFVNHVFTNDVAGLPSGHILYGMLLYPDGGVVDDLLVYRGFGTDDWFLVVNASNTEKDCAWLKEAASGYDVRLSDESGLWGEIALQGPEAERFAVEALGLAGAASLEFYTFLETEWKGSGLLVSRTGYTGEDGFEIYGTHDAIVEIWDRLLEAGVTPCGLGCRDTLRFEAGLPLYGHELSASITPLEAGLGMFVKTQKDEFVGREAILRQKEEGLSRKIVGIELHDKAVPRAGYPVLAGGRRIGEVTTGYRSISTDRSVCVAMLEAGYTAKGTEVEVQIRKKTFPGTVCGKRFYETKYRKAKA